MNKELSSKLRICSFISGVMIVILHAPTLSLNYSSFDAENYSFLNKFVQYFFVNGINRFGLPFFFILSGFLFFRTYEQKSSVFIRKFRNRLISLGIPYLLWSLLGILFFYLLESYVLNDYSYKEKQVAQHSITELIKIWLFDPYQIQLWFLPGLFKLIILSPIIYFLVKKTGIIFLLPLLALWFFSIDLIIISNIGLFYFSVGAYFAIQKPAEKKFEIVRRSYYFILTVWVILCLITAYLSTIYSFNENLLQTYIFKASRLIGIVCLWYGYDLFFPKSWLENKFFANMSSFGFFIYLIHLPLLDLVRNAMISVMGLSDLKTFIIFFLSPLFTVLIAVALGTFMRKHTKFIYANLTGNR